VAECGSGAEAVEAIARLRPHLLFLDVEMPSDAVGIAGYNQSVNYLDNQNGASLDKAQGPRESGG
jgi:CheY-like chemotaxis protein